MSVRDTQERWEQFWSRIDAETKAEKVSQAALFELSQYYLSLPVVERRTIDGVLAEWVLSDNESKRFDALALIDEHRIRSALPALEDLCQKLEKSREPGARFEKAKVDRIVAALT
jgi:hypothetical protein